MKGKRLIAVVLAMVVALGSVCWKPPKAEASFVSGAAALGCAVLISTIIGTTADMAFDDVVTENIGNVIDPFVQEFVEFEGNVFESVTDLYTTIVADSNPLTAGVLALSDEAGALIARFINWLQTEKGLEAGGEPVCAAYGNAYLSDGTLVYISEGRFTTSNAPFLTRFSFNRSYFSFTGSEFLFERYDGDKIRYYIDGVLKADLGSYPTASYYVLGSNDSSPSLDSTIKVSIRDVDGVGVAILSLSGFTLSDFGVELSSYKNWELLPKPEFQPIPNEISAGQALTVNTGLTDLSFEDEQAAADSIFSSVLAGTLSPTVAVENTTTDVPGTDTDTDDSILSWTKKIWQTVTDIPRAIVDAVAAIFVPSADFYPTAIADLKDAFSDRMGLLTYPISILFDFLDRVVNLSDQQPILRWGNVYLPGYATPLVAAGQYNLNDSIGTAQGKQVHDIYLVIVDAIMILAFLDLCRHKYQKIIHN